jgi:hypothetical protein
MATIVIVYDDNFQVLRVLRSEAQEARIYAAPNPNFNQGRTPSNFIVGQGTELFILNTNRDAILNSTQLDEQGRAQALAVFNTYAPGDTFQAVHQPGIGGVLLGDAGGFPRGLFPAFVDPS